jgi:sulfate transport system ATP-binding protein
MSITVQGVSKRFSSFVALDNVSVNVPSGSLLALLGPSGSGKTTLLRIIAGLETPDQGSVLYQDEDATHRPARERNVGFVFQHYALFRHMTVFENIAFGLRVRHGPKRRIQERVGELLDLIQLSGLEKRYPAQLSGGQRQRVALARALAPEPRLLLLDEPFGALDAKVRQELRQWLRRLHNDLHVTSVFVTHDQDKALEVADRVVVMRAGQIEQIGTPLEIFEHPASAFCHALPGRCQRLPEPRSKRPRLRRCRRKRSRPPSQPGSLYVRPHELEIARVPNGVPSVQARVVHINPAGSVARVQLVAAEAEGLIHVDLSPRLLTELRVQAGETVYLFPRKLRVFEPQLMEPGAPAETS